MKEGRREGHREERTVLHRKIVGKEGREVIGKERRNEGMKE